MFISTTAFLVLWFLTGIEWFLILGIISFFVAI